MKKELICKIYLYIVVPLIILINILNPFCAFEFVYDGLSLITDSYPKAGEMIEMELPNGLSILSTIDEDWKPRIESEEILGTISLVVCVATLILQLKKMAVFKNTFFVTIILVITILLNFNSSIPLLLKALGYIREGFAFIIEINKAIWCEICTILFKEVKEIG